MSIAEMIAGLTRLEAELIAAARRGMEDGAAQLQAVAVTTPAYNDDTGATRASTTAYVATSRGGGAAVIRRAAAEVRRLRFNDGQDELIEAEGPRGENLMIVLTVPTSYVIDLEERLAGLQAFLAPTLYSEAPRIWAGVQREIAEVLT